MTPEEQFEKRIIDEEKKRINKRKRTKVFSILGIVLFMSLASLQAQEEKNFVLTDNVFNPSSEVNCKTNVALYDYTGEGFKITIDSAIIKNGGYSIIDGYFVLWGYGARHTWIGKIAYKGYIFESDKDNPLQFEIIKNKGYVYIKGKGTITFPDSSITILPLENNDSE